MLKRCVLFFFLFSVVSPVFSATSTTSGSGKKPEMKFDSWRVGRSPRGTVENTEQLSFITSTGTSTYLEASVVYKGGTQPKNEGISPIDPDTVEWTLNDGLNKGWDLAEPPGTSWSGLHPSKLSGSTSFNVVAKFSFPAHSDTSYYTISGSCGGNNARRSRRPKHRDGEPMKITVKFSAKTYSGESVPLTLQLSQDPKDQIHQEHVDYNRVIPPRGNIIDSDGDYSNFGHVYYDFGHYDKMIDKGLKGYQEKWIKQINDDYRKGKAALTLGDFTLNSAYRNPHHNFEHAGSDRNRLSPHMYGYALDIQGRDVDGKGGADRILMRDAARDAGARHYALYDDTEHVHGDWAPDNWASRTKTNPAAKNDFKLPKQSTDKPLVVEKEDEKEAAAKLLPCGHAEGSAGSHVKTNHRWCGHTDWYCLGAAGHNYVKCPRKSDGDFCRTDPKYPGYHLPCDTSHVHTYLSDQPPKPNQVTPTTTDPKPKQVLPKDSDDDDSDDDDGGSTRVDPQVTSPCGHTHKKSASSSHSEVSFNCGKHSYYACTPPSSSETNRHITQTLACGSHVGRACTASSSHLSAVSCPTQNGVSCSYGSYYTCSPHTHAYPSTPKKPALQYHRCGHRLTASGNHSKVSSCSVTNANGDTCTNSRDYYVCTPHVHSFPDVPKSPPKPDPPVETYVTCGAGHRHKTSESSSHASVSFSCGSHSYYACQSPSSSEVSRHEVGLLPCGEHTHRRCIAARSHTQAMVCPGKNGKACTIGTYYVCKGPTHKHVYPETQDPKDVKKYACGHDTTHSRGSSYHAWVSSCRTKFESSPCTVSGGYYYCTQHAHKFVATCSSGHTYNPESDSAYNKHRDRTCRFSGCSNSWQACVDGWTSPKCENAYRKSKGWHCGAQ